jgi:hypothetical protein
MDARSSAIVCRRPPVKTKRFVLLAVLGLLLSACSATSTPEVGLSATASPGFAICDGPTNAPISSASMLPTESGAPAETDAVVRFTPGFEVVDPVACRGAITTLVRSPQFAAMAGDHIEVGVTASDVCSEAKSQPPYPCWRIDLYDYETRAGYQASISSRGVVIQSYAGGIPPSPEEASAATVTALADPAVSKALASGDWTEWLYELSPGSDSSPCRIERCISLRRWNTGGELLALIANLHRHSIEWSELP